MSGDTPRRFLVEHLSDFRYEAPAQGSLMVLRLQPRADGGQRVASFALDIDPVAAPLAFEDSFGNACHLFNIHRTHEHTAVHSRAEVETAPAPDLPERMEGNAWDALAEAAAPLGHWEFLAPSRFARASPALAAFAAGWWTARRFGGHTGDTLGAVQQVTELAVLLALAGHMGAG